MKHSLSRNRQNASKIDSQTKSRYSKVMHPIQEKLLKLSANTNLGKLSYRDIGKLIGESHPQKIKYHLELLERGGMIVSNAEGTSIKKTASERGIISIPILGSADCGPETIYAEENIEGYLRVSAKLLRKKSDLFALRAVGNSMNRADIDGKSLEDGDYAIIDSTAKDPKGNEYVVSVIDGLCNIKKFIKDTDNRQIVLVSESTQDFPPIYIHPEEKNYFVCGKVVQVIKKPR
jgi:SOS-response transcriptional repressor LexA